MKRGNLEDLSIDGRILYCIVKNEDGRTWSAFMWSRIGSSSRILTMVRALDSTKCGEFDQLKYY